MLVAEQGFVPKLPKPGPKAPSTARELLAILKDTRTRGYSIAVDSYIVGMAAMAVPVRLGHQDTVIGALSIAGPAARLTAERMQELSGPLATAAAELGQASRASRFFRRSMNLSADHRASESHRG